MNSVTHLAGAVVRIGKKPHGRVIQRCAVCGDKLCDNVNFAAPLGPDGAPAEFATWPEGHMVKVSGGRSVGQGSFAGAARLPKDFCLMLVEE